ncbi:MAG: DNA internalization-related competence protein ComEC/Rec2 [Thermoleophilia bacterium]
MLTGYLRISGLTLLCGFLAGIAISLIVHSLLLAAISFALSVLFLIIFMLAGKKQPVALLLLLLFPCLGFATGCMRLDALGESSLTQVEGKRVVLDITVTGRPVRKGMRVSFSGSASALRYKGEIRDLEENLQVDVFCRERCEDFMGSGQGPTLEEGSLLRVSGTVKKPPVSPGADFDYGQYLQRRGVNVVMTAAPDGVEILPGRRGGISGLVDSARHHARASLAIGDWGGAGALLQGMVLGDDDDVPDDVISDFRSSGILHLLAVSGQNVVLLGFIVMLLCRAMLVPRLAAVLIAVLVICMYVPLTGAGPSIVRAGIVGVLGMAAYIFSRQTNCYHFLAIAAAIILVLNPYSLLDPGFQLSFGAVIAIFLVSPVLSAPLSFLPAALREAVAISAAAGLVTAPITLGHFQQISMVTIPANVAAAPVAGPVMLLGTLSILIAPVSQDISWLLNALSAICTAYLIVVARFFASLPGAVYVGDSPGLVATVLFYGMLTVMVVIAERMGFRRWLAWLGENARLVLIAFLLLTALAGFACLGEKRGAPPADYRVSFLDVGQGDAVLIQVPGGATILVDGGPGSKVNDRLAESGVERLDAVVLTHPHADHLAGLIPVLEKYPVDTIIDAAPASSSSMYRDFLKQVGSRNLPYIVARSGQVMDFGELKLKVLHPTDNMKADDANANSVVLLAGYRGLDILLSGDAEGDVLTTLDLPQVEVFKVPHHGSRDSSMKAVLEKLKPDVAVISVGDGNSYGHPAEDTMEKLRASGARIFRTDRQGTIRITLGEAGVGVSTDR